MKLIKINTDHYVVVDETIQPVNGYYYDDFIKEIRDTSGAEYGEASHCWQITHSTIPKGMMLMEGIKRLSLQEVKELIGEVDVEKKAEIIAKSLHDKSKHDDWSIYDQLVHEDKELIKLGYNQALEDNKEKKYTEEQLIWAIQEAYGHGQDDEFDGVNKIEESIKAITKHPQPKTRWEVYFVDGKLKLK